MSKNAMIGAVVCAIPGMDTKHVAVLKEMAHALNGPDADVYRDRFLKGVRQPLPKGKPLEHKFLRPVVSAVNNVFNPEVYKNTNTKDIWVSEDFVRNILPVAEIFQPTDDLVSPSGFDVIGPANDSEIRS